jgi:hypothetical protein
VSYTINAPNLFHVLQGEEMALRVKGSHAITWYLHHITTVTRICNRVHDTDVRAHAHDDELLRMKLQQPLLQTGSVEAAETLFGDNLSLKLHQFRDDLTLGGATDTVRREHREFPVVWIMLISQVENMRPLLCLTLQQLLDTGDDRASSRTTV